MSELGTSVLLYVLGVAGLIALALCLRTGVIVMFGGAAMAMSIAGNLPVGFMLGGVAVMLAAAALYYYCNRAAFRRLTAREHIPAIGWSAAGNFPLVALVAHQFVTYVGNDRGILFPFGL